MADPPNSHVRQREVTPENRVARAPYDPGRERQIPGSNREQHLEIPEMWRALLGWLRGNTEAPVNQSGPKGKEVKVTGEKAEESALQCYGGGGGQGNGLSLFCFNHYVPDTVHGSCLAGGGCPWGPIRSVSPLSSHVSLHVAVAAAAAKSL